MMESALFYFINADGSGHTRRAEAIFPHLSMPIVVATENPNLFQVASSQFEVQCVPSLRSHDDQRLADDVLHLPYGRDRAYLPRVQAICELCQQYHCTLAVIDVCAETAMLMRLCGIPYLYMRMSGQRDDPAHVQCYRAATGLIASYPEAFEEDWVPTWMRAKTHYGGGIFTLPSSSRNLVVFPKPYVLVMRGKGMSQITPEAIAIAAQQIPEYRWIGIGFEARQTGANFDILPYVDEPSTYVQQAAVVIANTGNNSVLEIGYWRKPFIALPEWRFFDEQEAKAAQLARHRLAVVLTEWPTAQDRWRQVLAETQNLAVETWSTILSSEGAAIAARYITEQFEQVTATASIAEPPRSRQPLGLP